jgi:DNA polymerase I-like protein with 3'-5' exonuclease and polymerase domains
MKHIVVDLEANGLDDATRIHCLSSCVVDEWDVHTLYSYEDIINFFKQEAVFILHYGSNYDLPLLNRLLGIDFTDVIFYDTHLLSNYIFPGRQKYSLESFGEDYGVAKVSVGKDEWDGDMQDETYKDFITSRCETDIRINTNLWVDIMRRLNKLYDNDTETINKLLKYVAFKARRAYEQQLNPLLIDVVSAEDLLVELYKKKEEKDSILRKVMPRVPIYVTKEKPKVMYKKDGSVSAIGQRWLDFLTENNIPAGNEKPIKYIKDFEEPNPQSSSQLKEWLYSLGWIPDYFKYVRDKISNETRKVEQILDENKELTPSVMTLLDKEPALIEIEGLSVINHRISFVNGLLEEAYKNSGWVSQTLHALTSTTRFRHKNVVNVPSQGHFAKEIRSLFIPPVGHKLIGADLQALESKIRDHEIILIDPDYVAEMSSPDFDAHLDIAVRSGILTPQQAQDHKDGVADYSKERKASKRLNFAAIYGVAKKTLSINTGFSEDKCEQLILSYWERNWSVKQFSESLEIKKCLGFEWVRSPISGFYLELRTRKDTFSAVTQHGGVFMFDTWQMYVRHFGLQTVAEFHDECIIYVKEDQVEESINILNKSCKLANKRLNTRVTINITAKSGDNYYQIH